MSNQPYLSVVASSRNDNHGGDMTRRMQIFVNGLIEQCRRHQIETELILVEWNPPVDRCKLAEELTWNLDDSPLTVRIIEVPPELHATYNHAKALPLFQMIAKNVGIRRAKGAYVVATNVDLLFSDELCQFIASKQLKPHVSYRVDRYDVESHVPLEAGIEEQLHFCETHLLRINGRQGIQEFPPPSTIPTDLGQAEPIEPSEPIVPWYHQLSEPTVSKLKSVRRVYKALLPKFVRDRLLDQLSPGMTQWLIDKGLLQEQPAPLVEATQADEGAIEDEYPPLHTYACGDFTLLAKDDWIALRGYPEWQIYSLHIDSVFLYMAHYAGIEEVVLNDFDPRMRTYHMEHGNGWTPDAERTQSLAKRLASMGIPQLSYEQLLALAKLMQQTEKPLIVNDETWGLGATELPETVISSTTSWSQATIG